MNEVGAQSDMEPNDLERAEIDCIGIVQDVNFRFIFSHHAYRLQLVGQIWNDPTDENMVHLIIEGKKDSLDSIISILKNIRDENKRKEKPSDMAPIISIIFIRDLKIHRIQIDTPSFEKFTVLRPEEDTADQIHKATLRKLSLGGIQIQNFHTDHNENFHTLENKFGAISTKINDANNNILQVGSEMANMRIVIQDFVRIFKYVSIVAVGGGLLLGTIYIL